LTGSAGSVTQTTLLSEAAAGIQADRRLKAGGIQNVLMVVCDGLTACDAKSFLTETVSQVRSTGAVQVNRPRRLGVLRQVGAAYRGQARGPVLGVSGRQHRWIRTAIEQITQRPDARARVHLRHPAGASKAACFSYFDLKNSLG